jgi:hypothetical protein
MIITFIDNWIQLKDSRKKPTKSKQREIKHTRREERRIHAE